MINLTYASPVEQIWSALSLVALLLHGYLALQAALDWLVICSIPSAPHWRCSSARGYFFGQLLLFLPQLIFLYIGIGSMLLPPPVNERREQTAELFQMLLILAEVMFLLAAVAFWAARRWLNGKL